MEQDKVVERVRAKFLQRSGVGIQKYNKTLDNNLGEDYLKHLQEELMDACNYIETIFYKGKTLKQLITDTPNDTELGLKVRQIFG